MVKGRKANLSADEACLELLKGSVAALMYFGDGLKKTDNVKDGGNVPRRPNHPKIEKCKSLEFVSKYMLHINICSTITTILIIHSRCIIYVFEAHEVQKFIPPHQKLQNHNPPYVHTICV